MSHCLTASMSHRLSELALQTAVRCDPLSLPTDLASAIFSLVPVDARLRSREVSPAWRDFLSNTRLWRVCDLSSTRSGVVAWRTQALLQAACAPAQGTLEVVDVTGWRGLFVDVETDDERIVTTLQVLVPVLQANAGSLVELRAWDCFEPGHMFYFLSVVNIEALLAAALLLRLLECDAGAYGELPTTTLRLLEEPQFAPVRLQTLDLQSRNHTPLDVPALAARLSSHPSLKRLRLLSVDLDTEPALDAVVDLAISQLQHLSMSLCSLSPASLPALTRMLGCGSLNGLLIWNGAAAILTGPAMPAFCAAVQASRLAELKLFQTRLWESLEDGLAVIAACTGHPTLRALHFQFNDLHEVPGRAVIEAALDALEASNGRLSVSR